MPSTTPRPKTLLAWSSGKDSAWTLHILRERGDVEVVGLLTTIEKAGRRVSMHETPEELLDAQAEAVGLPVWKVEIPWPCPNDDYEAAMGQAFCRLIHPTNNAVTVRSATRSYEIAAGRAQQYEAYATAQVATMQALRSQLRSMESQLRTLERQADRRADRADVLADKADNYADQVDAIFDDAEDRGLVRSHSVLAKAETLRNKANECQRQADACEAEAEALQDRAERIEDIIEQLEDQIEEIEDAAENEDD